MRRILPIIAAALIAPAAFGGGEQRDSVAIADSVTGALPLSAFPGLVAPSDSITPVVMQTKSPGVAMALSAVLPGAGQAYNESYWKVPIALGLGAYFVSQWLHYNRLTSDARGQFEESVRNDPPGDPNLLRLREFYKDQRDTYTWYFLIFYLVNIGDAYVDAALFDFTVSDDLSLRVLPLPAGGVAIRLTF